MGGGSREEGGVEEIRMEGVRAPGTPFPEPFSLDCLSGLFPLTLSRDPFPDVFLFGIMPDLRAT